MSAKYGTGVYAFETEGEAMAHAGFFKEKAIAAFKPEPGVTAERIVLEREDGSRVSYIRLQPRAGETTVSTSSLEYLNVSPGHAEGYALETAASEQAPVPLRMAPPVTPAEPTTAGVEEAPSVPTTTTLPRTPGTGMARFSTIANGVGVGLTVVTSIKFAYDYDKMMKFSDSLHSGEYFEKFWRQITPLLDQSRIDFGDWGMGTVDMSRGVAIVLDNGTRIQMTYDKRAGFGMILSGFDEGNYHEYSINKVTGPVDISPDRLQ
jgi:hypothetical protein